MMELNVAKRKQKFKIEELASFQFMGGNQNWIGHTPQEVEILGNEAFFHKNLSIYRLFNFFPKKCQTSSEFVLTNFAFLS